MIKPEIIEKLKVAVANLDFNVDEAMYYYFIGEVEELLNDLEEANNESV